MCVALLLGSGDILRLCRYGIEIGPLDLLEQRLLQIEPREAAVLGGQPGLVHRRAVLAVREDRDAQRQPHVLVEAVPDLRAAFVAAARHVAGSDPGRERERRQESRLRLADLQLGRLDRKFATCDLRHGPECRLVDLGLLRKLCEERLLPDRRGHQLDPVRDVELEQLLEPELVVVERREGNDDLVAVACILALELPDIAFDSVKGIGAVSGVALKLLFMDAHLKVQDKCEVFDDYLQRRLSVIQAFLAQMNAKDKAFVDACGSLIIEPEIVPFMIEDEAANVNLLLSATGQKAICSRKTAVQQLGWVNDTDAEIEQIEAEESAASYSSIYEPTV